MNEGDIALAPLPQADGQIKNRPVVLLRRLPPFGDFIGLGGLQALVEPPDVLVAAENELPAGADRPALEHVALPLAEEGDQVAGGDTVFFVEDRGFVALGDEAAVFEGRVKRRCAS